MQHADLNGAKTAAAGKHKGGLRSPDLITYRHSALAPRCRGVDKAARRSEAVIAAVERGMPTAKRSFRDGLKDQTRKFEFPGSLRAPE
jgi:hypothetical protein